MNMRQLSFGGVVFLTLNSAFGNDLNFGSTLSADNQEAIRKTQELLRNPANLQSHFEAAKLFELMGDKPKDKQDLSDTTASIFNDLAKKTGGDPEKLKKLLDEARKNPEAFANQLSPEQKAAISEFAKKIEEHKSDKIQVPQAQK
jgi:hypothetical protein